MQVFVKYNVKKIPATGRREWLSEVCASPCPSSHHPARLQNLVAGLLEVVLQLGDGAEGVCGLDLGGVVADEDGLDGFGGYETFLALQ